MDNLRTLLETRQISIYFVATILALLVGIIVIGCPTHINLTAI